jgi:hypothetical protein
MITAESAIARARRARNREIFEGPTERSARACRDSRARFQRSINRFLSALD